MTVTTARPSRRVLHVLKHYQPDRKAARVPTETPDASAAARHNLLVTEARPMGCGPAARRTAGQVSHVFGRRRGPLGQQVRQLRWFLFNPDRLDAAYLHKQVEGSIVTDLMVRIAGRRVRRPTATASRAAGAGGLQHAARSSAGGLTAWAGPAEDHRKGAPFLAPASAAPGVARPPAARRRGHRGGAHRRRFAAARAGWRSGGAVGGRDPASITDTRFHSAFEGLADRVPRVITMVDAEAIDCDANQLGRFLGWLDEFHALSREEVGGRPANCQEIRRPAAASPPPSCP